MAKYKFQCLQTYETVIPATEMKFTSLMTGEEIGKRLPIPESRYTTEAGKIVTARNKKDAARYQADSRWKQID